MHKCKCKCNNVGGVNTIDMRAHGTQKTKIKAMCSHKTKTQAHGQQNKSPAMCKTGHEYTANENTHKPRVHTRHDNMNAHSQWKTRTVCNNTRWQEKHAAEHKPCATQNTTHVDRRAHGRANSRPHAHTRQNMEGECYNPDTKLKTRVPGSEHYAPTRNKARRWRECQGSVTKPWITLDRSDRTLTLTLAFSILFLFYLLVFFLFI